MKTFKDSRLPDGVTIFLNDFDEYVGVKDNRVLKVNNGVEYYNVRASRTLEGAIQHVLNNIISN